MNNIIIIKVSNFIYDIINSFSIRNKFDKQIEKIKKGILDNGLNFEKIKCNKNIYFYSFRIDIHYRAYLRKENGIFIVFDVNNHDYNKIKNKLKNMK